MSSGRRITGGPVAPRTASDGILVPTEFAGRIHNFTLTPDGTLRSVEGPVEYASSDYQGASSINPFTVTNVWGIHHAQVGGGERSILLMHANDGIWEHQGWRLDADSTGWTQIIGESVSVGAGSYFDYSFEEADDRAGFLTQFVSTATGVVIIPQGGRAMFYDGEVALPLGYADVPGPPEGIGSNFTESYDTPGEWKAFGYVLDGRNQPRPFGFNRVGTLRFMALSPTDTTSPKKSNPLGAILQKTSRRAKIQWIDYWGNLSPLSPASDAVEIRREDNLVEERKVEGNEPGEALRKQIPWINLDTGPQGTIGRQLYLTKNLEVSGDDRFFIAPGDRSVALSAFATIPDNLQQIWFDNVGDGELLIPEQPIRPVPNFRLAALSFGRLWIANWTGAPGALTPSLPGRWGTFPENAEIYPDPNNEVTGLLPVPSGLLACTETGTFLITLNDDGTAFRATILSRQAGCVSPNSMAVMPTGLAIWLGREGWYACDGKEVRRISADINNSVVRRINRGRWRRSVAAVDAETGQYRCWVPIDASRHNNLCVVYDGKGWTTRDDVSARAVCVTQDHRGLMLAAGEVDLSAEESRLSVWVLDHAGLAEVVPQEHTVVFETPWLRVPGQTRVSSSSVEFWLRSTSVTNQATLRVTRDWREYPYVEQHTDVDLAAPDDTDLTWSNTELGGTYTDPIRARENIPTHWTARRPYWYRVDVYVPDAEVFKAEFVATGDVDLIGMRYEDLITPKNGASKPSKR